MPAIRNPKALLSRRRELRQGETPHEKEVRKQLRNKQFMGLKLFRQYGVGPYVLDFFCPALKLAIELDGSQHFEPLHMEYDEARTRYLESLSIEVVRLTNREISENLEGVLEHLQGIVAKKQGFRVGSNSPNPLFTKEGAFHGSLPSANLWLMVSFQAGPHPK